MAAPIPPAAALSDGTARAPAAEDLALVPGLESGAPPRQVIALHGGTVNHSWRVDSPRGRFVLRLDGVQWQRPGVDRVRERALHGAAAQAGLAPAIVAASAERGVLVTQFVQGRHWSAQELHDPDRLERLAVRLAALHAVALPAGAWRFDPQALFAQYVARATPRDEPMIERIGRQLGAGVARVQSAAAPIALIHGDLVCGNLLEGERLWLLDFEYAQIADPVFDIACLLAYYPQLGAQSRRLLAAAGLGGREAAERLPAAVYVYRTLSWAWHLARGESAEDPVEFVPFRANSWPTVL